MELINQDQWCFAYPADRPGGLGGDRAALFAPTRWPHSSVITVSFLDGEPALQERVKAAAEIWTQIPMSLSFDFQDGTETTEIRISFLGQGSWSVLGTTCHQVINPTEPTMNFGWLTPGISDANLRKVVLHEFGHALGLIHEHQHPSGGIQWNKEAVYKELSGPPHSWSHQRIDTNLFEPYAAGDTNFNSLDATSIMMYPIPAQWTTNGFSTGINATLSELDKQLIKKLYG